MKKILTILLFLAPITICAQKIKFNGVDPFTNKITIETSEESLLAKNKFKNQWNEVKISLRYEDGAWSIPASVLMDKIQKFNPECLLVIRLSNGKVVSLHATTTGEAINSERDALGVATQTRVAPFITKYEGLTTEDIDAMKQYPITNIRVTSEMTHFEYEIKGKNSELLARMINLINSSINN